jgi:hypothetical protein
MSANRVVQRVCWDHWLGLVRYCTVPAKLSWRWIVAFNLLSTELQHVMWKETQANHRKVNCVAIFRCGLFKIEVLRWMCSVVWWVYRLSITHSILYKITRCLRVVHIRIANLHSILCAMTALNSEIIRHYCYIPHLARPIAPSHLCCWKSCVTLSDYTLQCCDVVSVNVMCLLCYKEIVKLALVVLGVEKCGLSATLQWTTILNSYSVNIEWQREVCGMHCVITFVTSQMGDRTKSWGCKMVIE